MKISIRSSNVDWFEWVYGPCASSQVYTSAGVNREYVERCCLAPGQYLLTCKAKRGVGLSGNLQIDSNTYCDDFYGYITMEKIVILGI